MTSIWAEGVQRALEQGLEMLSEAIRDCPDTLWEAPMWPVAPPEPGHTFLNADWTPVVDAGQRAALAKGWVARRSTPWSVAWHALESLDYDLSGEFSPWMPPPPFAAHPHWRDLPTLPSPWSRDELDGYVDHCRRRVRDALGVMTEEMAVRPLPRTHRYAGQPHALIIAAMVVHTAEHAAQIGQFGVGGQRPPGP